ncbi:hypothetical protein ABEH27_00560 [Pseudomonas sp. P39-UII1]|uniref:hypothetical protein n=1 Tax=Pseudomonas sp. P39-UII1 TaxID=3080333 RepID=UPI003207BF45
MSGVRKTLTLSSLSQFARLIPHGLPRDQVFGALSGLSLECSLSYDLSKSFLSDGWIVEYRHLRTAGQLNPVSDLLLFATSGGLEIEMADGSTHHVKCGEHVMLPADCQATVFPVGERDSVSFIALAIELDLGQILQELTEVPPA